MRMKKLFTVKASQTLSSFVLNESKENCSRVKRYCKGTRNTFRMFFLSWMILPKTNLFLFVTVIFPFSFWTLAETLRTCNGNELGQFSKILLNRCFRAISRPNNLQSKGANYESKNSFCVTTSFKQRKKTCGVKIMDLLMAFFFFLFPALFD